MFLVSFQIYPTASYTEVPRDCCMVPRYLARDRRPVDSRAVSLARDRRPMDSRAVSLARDRRPMDSRAVSLARDRRPMDSRAVPLARDRRPMDSRAVSLARDRPRRTPPPAPVQPRRPSPSCAERRRPRLSRGGTRSRPPLWTACCARGQTTTPTRVCTSSGSAPTTFNASTTSSVTLTSHRRPSETTRPTSSTESCFAATRRQVRETTPCRAGSNSIDVEVSRRHMVSLYQYQIFDLSTED